MLGRALSENSARLQYVMMSVLGYMRNLVSAIEIIM